MANEMSLEEKWEKAWLENNFIFYFHILFMTIIEPNFA